MVGILPAAGKGTRMASVAPGSKELLPLGSKTILDFVKEEAALAGAEPIVVVVGPEKEDLARWASDHSEVDISVQQEATGLAPAVIESVRTGPALILLPDTVFAMRSPSSRLIHAISRGYDVAIAVERVSDSSVSKYGIVEWNAESGRISRILEKPRPEQTTSRWAIAARFAISDRAFQYVRERLADVLPAGHEIHLPPLLGEAIQAGLAGLAVPLEEDERRLDCGVPEGYREACEVFDALI